MSDKYLEIANSPLGKKIFNAVGLPDPVPLRREDPQQAHNLRWSSAIGRESGC